MIRRTAVAALAIVFAIGLVSCGGDDAGSDPPEAQAEGVTTLLATTTLPPTTTTTLRPTTTLPRTTTTTIATTTTTTTLAAVDPSLPTYSEVVAEHWPGEELCGTQAGISGGPEILQFGPFGDEGATTSIREGFPMGFCPGAKYIVAGELVLSSGEDFPVGTLLTLDADLNFVAVSSWD